MQPRSKLDEVFDKSQSLDPDDRMRLIARLWESLPEDYWAAPASRERANVHFVLGSGDMQGLADLPRRLARKLVTLPANPSTSKIYSAPRRFDLATIFVVTFAYSLLFGMLSYIADYLDVSPAIGLIVGGFITLVGVGQAVLFGGQNARVASVLTGAVLNTLLNLIVVIWLPRGFSRVAMLFLIPFSAVFGAALGYMAGALVGGVFLVADKLRTHFTSSATEPDDDDVELVRIDADRESHVTS